MVDGPCICLIRQIWVKVHYIEGAFIVDQVVLALFLVHECVLYFKHYLRVVVL